MNKNEHELAKAKQLTETIMNTVPSGDVMQPATMCHVLQKVFKKYGIECLFFNSTDGKNLHDAFENLADLESNNQLFVLKLNDIDGLGGMRTSKNEHELKKFVEKINIAAEKGQSHPVIEDVLDRLSKVHHVDKKHISIMNIYDDRFNVVYKVESQVGDVTEPLCSYPERMKDQFPQFNCAKVHPLFNRPTFDISCFDIRGNRTFHHPVQTHNIGPRGHTQCYTTPVGWTRYGLNVMGKHRDGDKWLHPFQDDENWYRAYHGTKNAKEIDLDPEEACIDVMPRIYKGGFCKARVHAHGEGVYCSPNPKFVEDNFAGAVEIDTQHGRKKYKCMFMVAAKPRYTSLTKAKEIWVVSEPEYLRPYGILIKEISFMIKTKYTNYTFDNFFQSYL